MASLGGQQENYPNIPPVENTPKRVASREGSAERKVSKDREEKLKYARDRQNEERHRKIEELKAQAEAAQRYREQKEEERRRRIEDMRVRDTEKRHQVEERKKAIFEAEKERREYILKKNQERESRIETKRRDRNSIGFAFGSSTPRLLDVPADYGLVSPSAFWGQRRSTSISNVAGGTLSRRSSERELTDSGAKKRASSSADRHEEDIVDTSPIVFRSVYRRKTDLMPTIPSPREGHYGSRSSLSATPRTPGSRSGNVTPGGHLNNSRPGSAMSTSTTMSSSGYVPRRPTNAPRKPRPASIAGTGMSLEEISKHRKDHKPPVRKPAGSPSTSTAQTTPKRIGNLMTTSLIVTSSSSRINSAEKKTPPKRDITVPKAASASKVLPSRAASSERIGRFNNAAVAPKPFIETNAVTAPNVEAPKESELVASKEISFKGEAENIGDPNYHISLMEPTAPLPFVESKEEQIQILPEVDVSDAKEKSSPTLENTMTAEKVASEKQSEPVFIEKENELSAMVPNADGTEQMTASMMARKITTEEEAKAALAERRRLAREEAERQQELERQRIEAEQLALLKHQEEEAERQRQFEEEATRLAEEQRRSEEERLRKAIEEVKQREEEEQRRRFEEERQRAEREETEKKAKEEAEKQRVEVAERLKREEKEREERRKRVEAIMSRTRKGGGNSSVAQTSTPTKELIDNSKAVVNPKESSESSSNNSTGSPSNAESSLIPQGNTRDVLESFGSHPSNPMIDDTMVDKEASLIKSFTGMIIDENSKNLQQFEVNNGKLHADLKSSTIATTAVANGNGHMENVNNKNDINILQDAVTSGTTQLIDLNIQSQELHNNNNNSLLTTTTATTTLVTADSNESKDISLL